MSSLDFNDLALTGWYPGHMLKAIRQVKEKLSAMLRRSHQICHSCEPQQFQGRE